MNALDKKERLEVFIKNLMDRVSDLEGAVANEEGTFVERTAKLNETSKRVDSAAWKKDCLQARLY